MAARTPPDVSQRWLKTNTRPQKQAGYVTVTVALPLGDITANQLRSLADIVRRFTKETIRTTVEQNFVIRWVSQSDLPEMLQGAGSRRTRRPGRGRHRGYRHLPGHGHLQAGHLVFARFGRRTAQASGGKKLSVGRIRCSICTSRSAAASIVAASITWPIWDFMASAAKWPAIAVPHFQVVLGGEWEHNGGSYGLPVVAIPSKNIPQVVTRLTERYVAGREDGETFKDFVKRIGKVELKKALEDLREAARRSRRIARSSATGAIRANTRLGTWASANARAKSCLRVEFDLAAAEREVFEAQVALEDGQVEERRQDGVSIDGARGQSAGEDQITRRSPTIPTKSSASSARVSTTRRNSGILSPAENSRIISSTRMQKADQPHTHDSSRYLIDEAQLFIDAAHSCYNKMGTAVGV